MVLLLVINILYPSHQTIFTLYLVKNLEKVDAESYHACFKLLAHVGSSLSKLSWIVQFNASLLLEYFGVLSIMCSNRTYSDIDILEASEGSVLLWNRASYPPLVTHPITRWHVVNESDIIFGTDLWLCHLLTCNAWLPNILKFIVQRYVGET